MRIAVIEDEAPIREGMSKILKKINENYELVGKAENGKKGLELIRQEKPDLVILDIRMPDMDGLTMLSIVREEGIECKAIVLSAYSDFAYAQRAIELGIENYLLKPIKIAELKKALEQAEVNISKEQSKEQLFSLEYIFLNAITGQLDEDGKLADMITERYGIRGDEQIAIFGIGLSDNYDRYHEMVRRTMEEVGIHSNEFHVYVIEFQEKGSIVVILYQLEDQDKIKEYFKKTVVPMLGSQIPGRLSCAWGNCRGLLNIRKAILEMDSVLEWNLFFDRGTLISKRLIDATQTYPIKYPIDIEVQTKEAVADSDRKEFLSCLRRFREYCREGACTPQDMKEACSRYMMSLLHVAKESGKLESSVSMQNMITSISDAIFWQDIEEAFLTFFENLSLKNIGEDGVSLLVQKAIQHIQEYYNQGITLEEVAAKLHVSEEYLSTQFKKQTGRTFTETIRKYRIENVKELLLKSTLKLNQIADMVGYSDPKYMSKVFKDEVGMLPAEYRKKNS